MDKLLSCFESRHVHQFKKIVIIKVIATDEPFFPIPGISFMSVELMEYNSWLRLSTFTLMLTLTPGEVNLGRTD